MNKSQQEKNSERTLKELNNYDTKYFPILEELDNYINTKCYGFIYKYENQKDQQESIKKSNRKREKKDSKICPVCGQQINIDK